MKKILETVFHYVEVVCKVLMIIQVIAVSIVVIGRQVFSKTPPLGRRDYSLCPRLGCNVGFSYPAEE